MKFKIVLLSIFMLIFSTMHAQQTIKLWGDKGAPSSNEIKGSEVVTKEWVTNISEATMTIYLPQKNINKHAAIIICPGGGYAGLAINHEGYMFAKWLQSQGIAGIVLKYRLPNKHKEVPLDDAQQAIRYVRSNCKDLGIEKNKIGIAGFSAGGHLASTASTHFMKIDNRMDIDGKYTKTFEVDSIIRPNFSILFYPVVTMGIETHQGSKDNLLGDDPTKEDVAYYSNELYVGSHTPPTLLMLSDDDDAVSPLNSTHYYEALKKNNIPATMYIFPEGKHGWGMNKSFKYHTEMLLLLRSWLNKTLE